LNSRSRFPAAIPTQSSSVFFDSHSGIRLFLATGSFRSKRLRTGCVPSSRFSVVTRFALFDFYHFFFLASCFTSKLKSRSDETSSMPEGLPVSRKIVPGETPSVQNPQGDYAVKTHNPPFSFHDLRCLHPFWEVPLALLAARIPEFAFLLQHSLTRVIQYSGHSVSDI